ncbi:hypothetical protein BT69DRAFT_1188783, partial [Atractiella rhizophila]
LFMYIDRWTDSMHAHTKKAFLNWVNPIWTDNRSTSISGHSFRIGGPSLLLKLGFEIEYIRLVGRWKSISYELYLR